MSRIVIQAEHLSKHYRLGTIGYGSLKHDLQSWWARVRGQEDPNQVLGAKLADKQDFWALQDVNFEIEEGDRVGIIGRNGAGKSTLLKILSRVTAPTSGLVKVRGRIASLLEVGTGFHPELTGRENIYLNGAILGMKKAEITKNLDAIVDFSGVAQFLDTPVKRYSSGMYVRLAFAVAAHLEPDILIVDEVLAVGDAEFQKKCLGKMEDVSKNQGRTVLFVSHNMSAVQNLCSKGIFLHTGSVLFSGAIFETIDYYDQFNKRERAQPITERQDRKGKGRIRFSSISIRSIGKQAQSIDPEDEVLIEGEVKSESILDGNLEVSFVIKTASGQPVTNLSNFYEGVPLSLQAKTKYLISCKLNSLSLVPGKYSIDVYLAWNKEVEDWIEEILTFEVQERDVFRSGQIPGPQWPVIMRTEWKIL